MLHEGPVHRVSNEVDINDAELDLNKFKHRLLFYFFYLPLVDCAGCSSSGRSWWPCPSKSEHWQLAVPAALTLP